MIERLIEWSIKNSFIVIVLTVIIVFAGIVTMKNMTIDAIPDLSDVQVIIQTDFAGQAPEIIEEQVTYPLTTAMLSVPFAKTVRGYSFFGVSYVYLIFEDGTDMYWARSRVLEYLNSVNLPDQAKPKLGPDATGVGWVFQYSVNDTTGKHDLQQLRSFQDYFLRFELQTVPGVSEVASIGGFVKEYQIEVNPVSLRAYDLSISDLMMVIKSSNQTIGARVIEQAESEFMITSDGYIKSVDDIKNIVIKANSKGVPILLKDLADVKVGAELRRGLAESNGKGETVGGIIVMRYGENALDVIDGVKEKLTALKAGFPEGVYVETEYDRSKLIKRSVRNVSTKIVEEMIVVLLISLIFLLHMRSAFVAIVTVPVGILMSLILMNMLGMNANVMSLAGIGIAIGVMVDASIVMVENAHKKLESGKVERKAAMILAAKEVGPALFFSLLIVTISFFPVFTLEQVEGRLFKPLAFTKTFAMASSSLLAITLIPVLMVLFIKGKIRKENENPLNRLILKIYKPMIHFALNKPVLVILTALIILGLTIIPLKQIGTEFMPKLEEGDLLYMPTTLPGISITKAKEILQQTDKIIQSFPEVERTFGKIGRSNTATDPAPLSMIETTITLKDEVFWRDGMTIDKLITELNDAIQIPGLTNAWTMPIKTRIDMLATGIKTPVGIKIAGPDLKVLEQLGKEVESAIKEHPNTLSAISERVYGGNYLQLLPNREKMARYGMSMQKIQSVISSAIGGMPLTQTVEGLERYNVSLRYQRDFRDHEESIKTIPIKTMLGYVALEELVDISMREGPSMVKSENARLNAWIYIDIKDIDVGTYVDEAKVLINKSIDLPNGYALIWSGQYEYIERAQERLMIVIPITIVIIFILLFIHFRNLVDTSIIMATLPFALIGSIWFMYINHYDYSIAVAVGFIAVAGLAAETGIVMLVYLKLAIKDYNAEGKLNSLEDLKSAISDGAVHRVRPKIMTVATTLIGLLPMMFGTDSGAAIMKRIASPMIGGLFTSAVLTLIVIPAVYLLVEKRKLKGSEF